MARHRFNPSLRYRAQQTGLLLATGNVPLTFQRTLMPRSTSDQALVTGLSFATNQAFASLLQESLQSLALLATGDAGRSAIDTTRWSRASIAVDAAAIAGGLAVQRAFPGRSDELLPRAAVRTGGYFLAVTGLAGAIIGGLQEVLDRPDGRGRRASTLVVVPAGVALAVGGEIARRRRARLDAGNAAPADELSIAKSLGLSLAVAAGSSALSSAEHRMADMVAKAASRVFPGEEALWRPLGHLVSLAALAAGTRAAMRGGFHRIENREEAVEPSFDLPPINPLLSGSLDSLVPIETLSKQGRRFVWNTQAADVIAEVVGEEAMSPVRVYVGLESAPTEDERVDLALRELERTGAFDRQWLFIDLPTGTGYVNYTAVSALEMLARGNTATVALQYSARPSPLSLDRVDEGRHQARKLIAAIAARLRDVPPEHRPKVVLFGESLGAWTSQDAFVDRGAQGLVDDGIDYAIWIGTPYFSRWKEQVKRDDGPHIQRHLIGEYNDIDIWDATPAETRDRVRYVMITHHNDGVARFGPQLLFQAPEWLGDPESRAATIPKGMRWAPNSTFFQVLVDMKNSATVVPGVFAASGHDYRADLLPFLRAVLDIKVSDEQMQRIGNWLERRELLRSEWVKQHGTADTSMSASLLTAWMREDRDRANEVLLDRLRAMAADGFVAGGGAAEDAPIGHIGTGSSSGPRPTP